MVNKASAYIQGLLSKLPTTGPTGLAAPTNTGVTYIRHATRTRKSQPGLKRKGITFIPPVPPNTHKQARKPCNHIGARRFDPIRGATPAPTIDFVRKLEIALGVRLNVREGKIYYKSNGQFIDIIAVKEKLKLMRATLIEEAYQAKALAS